MNVSIILSHLVCGIGEGNGTPLQYSCLENPMDGGAWWAAIHGVAKSQTQLSNFTFTFHFHALEKEMAPHSSILAWRTPGTGEPGGLPSMGSHRVGHDWSDLAVYTYLILSHSNVLWSRTLFSSVILLLICSWSTLRPHLFIAHRFTSVRLLFKPSDLRLSPH